MLHHHLTGLAPWLGLAAVVVVLLWVDLRFFARGREPGEAVAWSVGWLVLGLAMAAVVLWLTGLTEDTVTYTTVYLIERSLSLDNLFVFLLLFAYFGVAALQRPRLLFWGIVAALILRGVAILGGVALIQEFHFVVYILGALLLLLAYRVARGVGDNVDPDKNLIVRGVRKLFPVTGDFRGSRWFVRENGRLNCTPLFVCLAAIVAADIAFAVDSIPAAFAITRDPFLIWMGNVFALLGLRALFVLVEGLVRRFRYMDETIAFVLAAVGVKLLLEDVLHVEPYISLIAIALFFTVGIVASLIADANDPESDAKRDERAARLSD